jgi:chromate transport protein ChrA
MILVALMFVFGAWNVQHLAQLPSLTWLVRSLLVVIAIIITQIHPRFSSNSHQNKFLKVLYYGLLPFYLTLVSLVVLHIGAWVMIHHTLGSKNNCHRRSSGEHARSHRTR